MNKQSNFITVQRENEALVVTSEYWTVCHNLVRGGCIDDVRIRHGSGTNLLAGCSETILNAARESDEPRPGMRVDELPDGEVELTFTGHLGEDRTAYEHRYHYTPWSMRQRLTLTPSKPLSVRHWSATRTPFSETFTHYTWGIADFDKAQPRFMHIVGPHYDDRYGEIPSATGDLQADEMRPWSAALIRRGIEGLQWCGDAHVYQWDGLSAQRRYRLVRTTRGIVLEMTPVLDADDLILETPVTLGWYWILPNLRRLGRRRYYEVAIQSTPAFPPDDALDAWKAKGVNLIRLHDDIAKTGTDDYWHDGRHPPYEPDKMRRLRRFIDAVHHRDMQIIPYFSGHELSPDTPLFAAHADEWASLSQPRGAKRYTPCSRAGVYGALMCPASGWSDALEKNIRAAIDELGFDGFYLDWTDPQPCFNERHLPGSHNGIDAQIAMLERLRRHLPDGVIVNVSAGKTMLAHNLNVADQYVTFEEGLRDRYTPDALKEYPVTVDYMGVGTASAVPDILYDRERVKLYRGLVHVALFGFPPYPYANDADRAAFGYASWREEVDDPCGIFATHEKFSRFDWKQYHFYSVATGVSSISDSRLAASVYLGDGRGVLVAGNLGLQPVGDSIAHVNLAKTCFGQEIVAIPVQALGGWEFRLIPFSYSGKSCT